MKSNNLKRCNFYDNSIPTNSKKKKLKQLQKVYEIALNQGISDYNNQMLTLSKLPILLGKY